MGSPGRNLNIPEQLRAWHEAGLHYVLKSAPVQPAGCAGQGYDLHGAPGADQGDPMRPLVRAGAHASDTDLDHAAAAQRDARVQHSGETDLGAASRRPTQPELRASAYGSESNTASIPADTVASGASELSQPVLSQSAEQNTAGGETANLQPQDRAIPEGGADFRQWPEPWRSLWLKTPHDPRIIWTYFELGAHMGGRPDPNVGKLLQSLIYYFRWAKGTIAFWPMTELSGDQLLPNPDMFWQGVDKLGARHVAIFGPNVLTIIAPDAPAQTKIIRVGEVTLYVLPGLDQLAPMLPHERLIALQSVKQLSL